MPLVLNLPNEAKEIETAIKSVSDSVRGIKDDYLKDDETVDDSVVNNIRNFRNEFEKTLESEEINRVVVLIDDLFKLPYISSNPSTSITSD